MSQAVPLSGPCPPGPPPPDPDLRKRVMKIIAVEEAFAMDGLKMVPQVSDFTKASGSGIPIDPDMMKLWDKLGRDFTEFRIPDMDASHVSLQVLSLTAPGIQAVPVAEVAVENARLANDYLADVIKKHPRRFAGFAALPLQDPAAAAAELNRCVKELGFCGALVNDTTNGRYLDHPDFLPVWQAIEDLQVPLYLHPGARIDKWSILDGHPELGGAMWEWQAQVGGHAMRLVGSGIFDRHPGARLLLGHMGEFLPFQLSRFDSRYAALRDRKLEKLPSKYFGENIFITTSGVFSPSALAGAVMAVGEDAILFAIDYPYESSEDAVRFLQAAPLSNSGREKIAWRNAARLLRLD